ncbi:MAG: hypothetical protein ACPGXZ_07365 [Saprospiraceae bacterium]
MVIINILKNGITQFWQNKRILFVLYGAILGAALLIALPIKAYLESHAGHSLMVEDLVKGFDYTFLNDFMTNYGSGFAPIFQQSLLVIILFLMVMIFLIGGILSIYQQQPNKWDSQLFWGKSAVYFWKMFRLSIYFVIIHFLVIGLFGFFYYLAIQGFSLKDDTVIFTTWKWLLPLYIIVSAFFFMWHDYTKIMVINHQNRWLYTSTIQAFRFILKNFKTVYLLFLLNIGLLFLVYGINYFFTSFLKTGQNAPFYIAFLISQFFLLARLSVKLINWSSASILYKKLN